MRLGTYTSGQQIAIVNHHLGALLSTGEVIRGSPIYESLAQSHFVYG